MFIKLIAKFSREVEQFLKFRVQENINVLLEQHERYNFGHVADIMRAKTCTVSYRFN